MGPFTGYSFGIVRNKASILFSDAAFFNKKNHTAPALPPTGNASEKGFDTVKSL